MHSFSLNTKKPKRSRRYPTGLMAKVDSSFGLVRTVSVGMHVRDRLGPIFHPPGLRHFGNSVLEDEGYWHTEDTFFLS